MDSHEVKIREIEEKIRKRKELQEIKNKEMEDKLQLMKNRDQEEKK